MKFINSLLYIDRRIDKKPIENYMYKWVCYYNLKEKYKSKNFIGYYLFKFIFISFTYYNRKSLYIKKMGL